SWIGARLAWTGRAFRPRVVSTRSLGGGPWQALPARAGAVGADRPGPGRRGLPRRSARSGREPSYVDVAYEILSRTHVPAEHAPLRGLSGAGRGALAVHAGSVSGTFRPVRQPDGVGGAERGHVDPAHGRVHVLLLSDPSLAPFSVQQPGLEADQRALQGAVPEAAARAQGTGDAPG